MNSSKTVSDVLNLSEKFRVLQNNTEIPVYEGADFDFAHMVITDFSKITIVSKEVISNVDIRPTRRNKSFVQIDDHSIEMIVCRGDYLSVEINGNIERPLLLFADQKKLMSVYDGYNVIAYTEPGYYELEQLELASNTILYIGEGVFLDTAISAQDSRNIRIMGNGILHHYSSSTIRITRCSDVEVNGITIIGKNNWNFYLHDCKNVVIENLKILADEIWSDGIDILGGEHILIRHIFIKNEDDCVCIKSSYTRKSDFKGFDVRNILVEDCVFWNGPRGNSMEIGYETNNSVIENIMFRNVDVIHRETQESKFHRSIISIHNSGNAHVRNITYENIYAESSDENFVQIAHMYQPDWGYGRGIMENIYIRNLTLAGGEIRPSKVSAYAPNETEPRTTRNIVFENLTILGDPIRSREDAIAHGFTLDEDSTSVKFI